MSSSNAGALRVCNTLGLVVLVLWWGQANAGEACPLILPGETIATLRPPAEWRAQVQREVRLYTAGLIAGDPSEGAYLKPLKTELTRNGDTDAVVSTWDLGVPRKNVWLYCGYGDAVEMFRPIQNHASKCVMTSKVRGRAIRDIELVCN
ncbi:STY0301 family protein [Massilia sp. GCM10020059]|uniref:STY0301 family protein n=1 Tax=Massilia TaxID=149698 RepID=UPI003530AD4C